MEDVYVVEALRTPFGSLAGMHANTEAPLLAASVINELLKNTSLEASSVDEAVIGQVLSAGCGQAPARQAMRAAGLPDSAHAMTINKVCGSGLKAILLGADAIMLGASQLVIAGGMENMSRAPYALKKARGGYRMGHGQIHDLMILDGLQDPYDGLHMGEIGEESTNRHGISRDSQDEYALRSYRLAQTALTEGIFRPEIVVMRQQAKHETRLLEADEEPFKADVTKLATLKPAFREGGTITAGNASSISDGAALALLSGKAGLRTFGLEPKARLIASACESCHPHYFPEAPVGAILKVCKKAGLEVADMDLLEINEAFASVVLHAITALNLDPGRVNVNGGAIAIGHPIGASGARLVATIIRELHRRQKRYGLVTLCIGGGEALAAIFERV